MSDVYQLDEAGNWTLGAGYFLFQREGEDEWWYLAETPDAELTNEVTKQELMSVDGPQSQTLEDPITSIDRSLNTSIRDISQMALELFFGGTASEESQSSVSAQEEDFASIKLGAIYSLGTSITAAPAQGYRLVASVSIEEDPDGTPVSLVEGTDYQVDLTEGNIKILASATNVSEGDDIRVTYDVTASTTKKVVTSENSASTICAMKFISDNTRGDDRTYIFPRVDFGPNGPISLKSRDTYTEVPMVGTILKPEDGSESVIIVKKAVAS